MKGIIWFIINTFFTIVYLAWRVFFTIPFGNGALSVFAGIALLVVEGMGMAEAIVHYMNMYNVKGYPKPVIEDESLYPDVDVFIATYSEPVELLYKTVNGCKHMEYPDKSKVHIYLCDDNRRPEMRELAMKLGVNYLDRPDNEGAKAGNLNNALKHSSSPYVVTFDADMIPQRKFLMETIPYFIDAEQKNAGREEKDKIKLGYLQTPQTFYNPDLFQFGLFSENRIPNEQDYFYRDIETARTKTNSVIYGGSNTVLAREALDSVGGFYTKAITEDFATGILIQKNGYVTIAIPKPLASGMSPTDLPSLVQQRVRWGRGVIATGRKMHIYTSKDLSFAQKMNYWASIWYWYAPIKRLIYILSPIMYATFNFIIFKCTLPQVLLFWLPMFITSNISLSMLSGNIRNTKWTGIYETILFPYMLLPVILESFGITLRKFKVTQKEDLSGKKQRNEIYLIPFLILIVLCVVGIFRCVTIVFDSNSIGPVVVIFWLVTNLYYLIMSVLFVDGRMPYRKNERISLKVPCTATVDGKTLEGSTLNISEEGAAILFDKPYYIDEKEEVATDIAWDIYKAKVTGKCVYVKAFDDGWSYSFKLDDYNGTYDDWLQIIYDRVPMLPSEIKRDSGIFEDLTINTKKRIEAPFFQKRAYPRIPINADTEWKIGNETRIIKILDFNYHFLSVSDSEDLPEESTVLIKDKLELHVVSHMKAGNRNRLYRVENIEELVKDDASYKLLLDWFEECSKNDRDKAPEEVTLSPDNENKAIFDENKLV